MLRFCLIGHRISYSLSPVIHRKVFSLLGLNYEYEIVDIEPSELEKRVSELFSKYHGFNVTIPYKVVISRWLSALSPEAKVTGAVNTVRTSDRSGYNTDIYGIVHSLNMEKIDVKGTSVLVLGAGGAARAAVYAFHVLGAERIVVCNRTLSRALELREHFRQHSIEVQVEPWERRDDVARRVDVIINCTPIGTLSWSSPLSDNVFREGQIVIDMVYRPRLTKMLKDALNHGAKIIDGLRILIMQALEADKIWLGIDVVREDVYRQVEEEASKYV